MTDNIVRIGRFVTVKQIAEWSGWQTRKIRRDILLGELGAIRIGTDYRVPPREAERYLRQFGVDTSSLGRTRDGIHFNWAGFVSTTDAASVLGVSREQIRRMIAAGDLKAVRLSARRVRIRTQDFWCYIDDRYRRSRYDGQAFDVA